MRKMMILFLLVFCTLGITACEYKSEEYMGFAKKDFEVVEEADTHGGLNGDGSYYLILDCSENKEKALENIKKWKKLPLSENLSLIMYGGEKDGVAYCYNLAEEAHLSEIDNGYYCFIDRLSESEDKKSDSQLFDRGAYNFSLAVYDADTALMYYFEYDT